MGTILIILWSNDRNYYKLIKLRVKPYLQLKKADDKEMMQTLQVSSRY